MILKLLIPYLILINLAGYFSMRRDKRRAAAHGPRTPERRLFAYALLGGSAGCLLGMRTFRHKTRHPSFAVGMPLILLAQILIAAAIAYRYF